MREIFLTVLEMSVTASYVIGAILLIRLLLKKAPRKYSYVLWLAAAFRLSCPFSFESALSIFTLRKMTAEKAAVADPDVQVIPVTPAVPEIPAVYPQETVTLTPEIAEPAPIGIDFAQIGAAVWLAGMVLIICYALFSWAKLKYSLRTAVRLERNVLQADMVRSPFILGFIRPKIYIPFGLGGERLDYVLAHERCHLRRLDHIIKPAAFLLLAVHWFNPLVWLGFGLMSRDMEMSCDEKVLDSRDNIRKAYSTTLLSFAAGRNFPLPSPLAFGESSVKSRIKNILSWKKPALWVTLAAVMVSVIAVFCCAADPESDIPGAVSASFQGSAVSDEAKDELVQMVNSSGKRIHGKNYARSADDDSIVIITCEDGSFYELHYWYNSGFSLLRGEEDDYSSMLTRYSSDGKAERTWKMENDFDEHFKRWLEYNLSYSAPPFGHSYRVAKGFVYDDPDYSQSADTMPRFALTADGSLQQKRPGTTEWETLGRMEQFEPDRDNFDRYLHDEDGWGGYLMSAAKLRRENAEAWRLLAGEELYYLLRQKDGSLLLAAGWYDESEADDYYSDDSAIRWIFALEEESIFETPAGSYVSWNCIYMTPFSSYYPAGGDSGEQYLISARSFTIQNRASGAEQVFETDWSWGEFPYSVEEWEEFQAPLGDVDLEYFADRQCITLSSRYDLFRMNGEMWLVRYGTHPDGERYVWSIFSLMPKEAMGSAQWQYEPHLSSKYPAFPFRFELGDLEYDEISVFCSKGSLADFDAAGNQAVGTLLTFPAGNRVYWNPMSPETEGAADGTALTFTGYLEGRNVFGTIYISGKDRLYTAELVGTALSLEQADGGLITLMTDSHIKRTENVPGGDTASPGGTIMWRQGDAGIQLTLPKGWRGEFYEHPDAPGQQGISFGPGDGSAQFELMHYPDIPAICGTGVTFGDVELKDGDIVTFATENIMGSISLHVFFEEEHYRLNGTVPAEKWPEYRNTLTAILDTVRLGEDVPVTDQGHAVTFTAKDSFSTLTDSITHDAPGSGGDSFAACHEVKGAPIDPFRVDLRLPVGWTIRQPEENDATYAAMTFQPMNIYDEAGILAGTIGYSDFTADQAEIHSGEEPDGKWGPENYRGIYWHIMTGYYNWDNDFAFVGDPENGAAVCRVKYDEASPMVDKTAFNNGVLVYDKELMKWIAVEIIDGAMSEQELIRLAESVRFSPVEIQEETLPLPSEKIPSGYGRAVMGFDYDQQPGSGRIFNVELVLPEGWTLSVPGDAVYGSPINPVFSIHDGEGNYIATVHRNSYTPVPEAAGQWNEFRAVYSDIMLGSGCSWGMDYTPVTRSGYGETAVDEIWYADWFVGGDEPVTRKGILSYDSRYEEYIAVEFVTDIDEDTLLTIAQSIRFADR